MTDFEKSKEDLNASKLKLEKNIQNHKILELDVEKTKIAIKQKEKEIISLNSTKELTKWKISKTNVVAPADGFVSNFILREGQYIGLIPRLHMYTEEKYVMLVINHQGIRNIKPGQYAEFASPVYPGKIFSGEVQAVIEATGESTGSLLAIEQSVSKTLVQNKRNKFHYVRVELNEEDDYDLPLGSSGMGWISAEKPHSSLAFLDFIRGIIIRMKAQLYYVITI